MFNLDHPFYPDHKKEKDHTDTGLRRIRMVPLVT